MSPIVNAPLRKIAAERRIRRLWADQNDGVADLEPQPRRQIDADRHAVVLEVLRLAGDQMIGKGVYWRGNPPA